MGEPQQPQVLVGYDPTIFNATAGTDNKIEASTCFSWDES
jgi:hypothetical protein